jgi:hypothetical protein
VYLNETVRFLLGMLDVLLPRKDKRMTTLVFDLSLLIGCFLFASPAMGESATAKGFEHFVTRRGNKLMEGDKEFRFVGANMPGTVLPYDFNLYLPERLTLPTPFEQEDACKTLARMGGRVLRTWNLPMRRADEPPQPWHYILGPGQFNEHAFVTIDWLLAMANKHRVRVMLCLSAEAGDFLGGIHDYERHRGKPKGSCWTDPQLREDYKTTVRFVLNRVNTVTGVPYKDDRAIFAWQFGNEMNHAQTNWLSEMAATIKSLDPNHLVAETRHESGAAQLIDPNIDLLTRHYYTNYGGVGADWIAACRKELEAIGGQRPFFVGEFGPYINGKNFTRENVQGKLRDFLNACTAMDGMSGVLLWSMYFHHQNGGFYWHQYFDRASAWSYHYPGFPGGDAQAEWEVMHELREAGFQMQGLKTPLEPAPDAPELIPFQSVPMFSWRGSAGATGYDIERAASEKGPWTAIAKNVSDADIAYRPLYSDESAKTGESWFYRVIARNASGLSQPSNVVGPVTVTDVCLADECQDLKRLAGHSDGVSIDNAYNACYAEYTFRMTGTTNDWITYSVPGKVREVRMTAFFQPVLGPLTDPAVSASADGKGFSPMRLMKQSAREYKGPPYAKQDKHRTQVDYVFAPVAAGTRHVKITWTCPMSLDRVEIHHLDP